MLGEGDRRPAQKLGELGRQHTGVPVGGLGGGEDQVGLGPLDGGGEHLGGGQRVRALEGGVADEDGLGRAHGEGGAQAAHLVVGGHGHEGDLATARLVGQLEAHLHAIGV